MTNAFFATIEKSHPLWSKTSGTQLISWSELQRTCNRLQLCHLNVESRGVLSGHWSIGGGCSNFGTFFWNPFVLLPPSAPFFVVLGHSIDQRQERTSEETKLNYPQLGVTLIRLKTAKDIATQENYEVISQSKFWNKREVCFAAHSGARHALVFSTYLPNLFLPFWVEIFSLAAFPRVELRQTRSEYQQTVQDQWHSAYLLRLSASSTVRLIVHQPFESFVPLADHQPIGLRLLSTTTTNDEGGTLIRARSISKVVQLNADEEYFLVPISFERKSTNKFELNVLADVSFTLERTERELPKPQAVQVTPQRKPLSLSTARLSTMVKDYAEHLQ